MNTIIKPYEEVSVSYRIELHIVAEDGKSIGRVWHFTITAAQAKDLKVSYPT